MCRDSRWCECHMYTDEDLEDIAEFGFDAEDDDTNLGEYLDVGAYEDDDYV